MQSDPVMPNVPDIQPDYIDLNPPGENAGQQADALPRHDDGAARARRAGGSNDRPAANAADADSRFRQGECVPNLPDVEPEFIGREQIAEPPRSAAAGQDEVSLGMRVPVWLRWSYFAATLIVIAVFGLFLFSQSISALALAQTLPTWAQYTLLIPLAFCALVMVGVCVSLIWSWFRLRSFRQINLQAVEELRARAETRQDGLQHYQTARTSLEKYLREYPLVGRDANILAKAGIADSTLDQLARDREYLFGMTTDAKSWLDDFHRHFQDKLDQAAAGRIRIWSLKAAGCAMASPLPLLDAILILSISLRLIRDLCVIYNIRTGKTASLVLLTRAIRNAFIAGVADDASELAGDFVGDQISEILGDSAFSSISSSIARAVAPKLGEGAVNGLFMRRLGKATVRLLQPLRRK
ncbi:MAG: DUF697 domain-containing protein [Planctomycetes bacterium]|nr:DUF697 domain-containing protein [Planctomycetota bacterium]